MNISQEEVIAFSDALNVNLEAVNILGRVRNINSFQN